MTVIVLTHVGNGAGGENAVEHRNACQSSPGPAATADAHDFHTLRGAATPRRPQRLRGITTISGQSKVRPTDPPALPRDGRRLLGKQVEPELGRRTSGGA